MVIIIVNNNSAKIRFYGYTIEYNPESNKRYSTVQLEVNSVDI